VLIVFKWQIILLIVDYLIVCCCCCCCSLSLFTNLSRIYLWYSLSRTRRLRSIQRHTVKLSNSPTVFVFTAGFRHSKKQLYGVA